MYTPCITCIFLISIESYTEHYITERDVQYYTTLAMSYTYTFCHNHWQSYVRTSTVK